MDFIQILALSFQCLVPGLKYYTHVRKSYIVHKKTKSLQSGSHMFLNVRDELGPVPSILVEVVGVVSQHDAAFLEDL